MDDKCLCLAGYEFNEVTERCDLCPAGKYQPYDTDDSDDSCQDCFLYSTTNRSGAVNITECNCVDTFVEWQLNTCDCPPGYALSEALQQCFICEQGKYQEFLTYDPDDICLSCIDHATTDGAGTLLFSFFSFFSCSLVL